MSLTAFNPHRAAFECKHEADVIPSIDQEADRWNRQAMALTSSLLWPNQRDYKGAVDLWTKAAERKHWQAMLNLANAYAQGDGVERDSERAVQIVEQAMKLGVPAAYDLMGTYYMNGTGVKQDASRAYGFLQLAADMGNPNAMAYLGGKMDAVYDDPKAGFWGNRKIALQMLECGFAQGNGDAAYALGTTLVGSDKSRGEDNERALRILHDGVKYGSARSAAYLFGAFDDGDPVAGNAKDRARAERYIILADRLERDPDLRLPNLDKVVPLPPSRLPKWDGNKETLINAARAAMSVPVRLPNPACIRSRCVPVVRMCPMATCCRRSRTSQCLRGTRACPVTGIWQASMTENHPRAATFNQRYRQGYVAQGDAFPDPRDMPHPCCSVCLTLK
jgi:TPR repeat protein